MGLLQVATLQIDPAQVRDGVAKVHAVPQYGARGGGLSSPPGDAIPVTLALAPPERKVLFSYRRRSIQIALVPQVLSPYPARLSRSCLVAKLSGEDEPLATTRSHPLECTAKAGQ